LVAFGLREETILRIATYKYQGRRQVGLVSDDGSTVRPLQLGDTQAQRGALFLIEEQASGMAALPATGPAIRLDEVKLVSPACAAPQHLLRGAQLKRPRQGAVGVRVQKQSGERRVLADRVHQGARMRDRSA
jgi:hypothetical protein